MQPDLRAGRRGKDRSVMDAGGSLSEEWTEQVKDFRQVRQELGVEEEEEVDEEEVNARGTDPKPGAVKPKRKIRAGIPEAAFPHPYRSSGVA